MNANSETLQGSVLLRCLVFPRKCDLDAMKMEHVGLGVDYNAMLDDPE